MILKERRPLLFARHLEPDIGVFNAHSCIGGKNGLFRRILLVMIHLLDLVAFLELLHLLASVGRSTTESLLRFLNDSAHGGSTVNPCRRRNL